MGSAREFGEPVNWRRVERLALLGFPARALNSRAAIWGGKLLNRQVSEGP